MAQIRCFRILKQIKTGTEKSTSRISTSNGYLDRDLDLLLMFSEILSEFEILALSKF